MRPGDTDVLYVSAGASTPFVLRWNRERPFTIGRLPVNSLPLTDDMEVSRRHAELRRVGHAVTIHDLGSANGTLLNGELLQVPVVLVPGDRIGVGRTEIVFNPLPQTENSPAAGSDKTDVLYVRGETSTPFVIRWHHEDAFTIGRLPENSLALTDDIGVSRRHAELRYVGDAALVQDLGSANGTRLNGAPIQAPVRLSPGARITVGSTDVIFNPSPPGNAAEAWLHVRPAPGHGDTASAPILLPQDRAVLLGRAPECDVALADPTVSEEHASIQPCFDDYVLTDLSGSGETFLNGAPVVRPTRLESGDELRLGNTTVQFDYLASGTRPAGASVTTSLPSTMVRSRGLSAFAGLPPELVQQVVARCERLDVVAGAPLVTETGKQTPAALYVLLEGRANVLGTVGGREEQPYIVGELGPGDFVGERALLTGVPFPRVVVADTSVRVLRLTRAAYQAHLAADPRLRSWCEEELPRLALSRQVAGTMLVRTLPREVVEALLARMQPAHFARGDVLARQDERCDRFVAVADGLVRIQVARGKQETSLGCFSVGECFGEAIAADDGTYSYTLIADTPVQAYTLSRADYEAVVANDPTLPALLASRSEQLPPNLLLARIAPFNALPPQLTTRIAAHMRLKSFRAGELIVEQDDLASAFYIVQRGSLRVSFRTTSGEEKVVTTLGAGQHFGEAALLTGEGRNATVTAAEDCQLWALYNDDFEEALRVGRAFQVGAYFSQDLRMRSRPRRLTDVEIVRQAEGDATGFMLHRPSGKSYLRLSERGMFVWSLLDGDHTINDLCVAYFAEYNTFDVELIASTVAQLQALGFIEVPPTDVQRLLPDPHTPGWQRALTRAFQVLSWRKEFPHADDLFTKLYKYGGWLLFTPPALVLLAVITLAGLAAFVYLPLVEMRVPESGQEVFQGSALAIIPIGFLLITVLHEMGHALTCKHYGRRVNGAGIGIAYFFPYAFVGTSDIWMAGKGPRIAVSAAGPLINLWTGSLCALAAVAVPDVTARSALFVLAAMSYLLVLSNLHPFMELDGYFILVDWLEMPSLRKRAMRFLRRRLWPCLVARRFNREERVLAIFGVAVFLFTVGMGLSMLLFFHDMFLGMAGPLLPSEGGELLGWGFGALLFLIFLIPFAFELELFSPSDLTLHDRDARG